MRRLHAGACLAAALVLAAPARAEDVRAAVEAGNHAFITAYLRGDAQAIGQLYTEDAQVLPPGGATVRGREAIAAYWEGSIASGIRDVTLHTAEVESAGPLAIETGKVRLVDADGRASEFRYLVVWKRVGTGWKMHRDTWNAFQ
jgi:uncharacterized protein (TIGR02246 family)